MPEQRKECAPNLVLLNHSDGAIPASTKFTKIKPNFKTARAFLKKRHSLSPLIEYLHNKVFQVTTSILNNPDAEMLQKHLSYLGYTMQSYDHKTKKFTRSNNTKTSIRKIDPFGKLQAMLGPEKEFYMTICGSPEARALRFAKIPLHYSIRRSLDPNFKDHAETEMNFVTYLGGFNYDGLLLISTSRDFTDLKSIVATAQIKTLYDGKPIALRSAANTIRAETSELAIVDLLGKRDIKQYPDAVSNLVKQAFAYIDRSMTIHMKDIPYRQCVLLYGFLQPIPKDEDNDA